MKTILSLIFCTAIVTSFAQEIFKEGKKYGISKYGEVPTKENGDSLIFRADYDKIESVSGVNGMVYIGLRGEEWSFLSSNKIVFQQRYESIDLESYGDYYITGTRDGYIDVYDTEADAFLIRSVKADELYSEIDMDVNNVVITRLGKEFYGVINSDTKKEVLKAEYTRLYANYQIDNTVIAFKEGTTYLYQTTGEVIFQVNSELDINEITEHDAENCYELKSQGKKGTSVGFYAAEHKWFIEPIYTELKLIENDPAVAIVHDGKGYGLYFEGKQLLPCEYLDIQKGDKQGVLAIVTNKKGDFYLTPDGKLRAKTE